MYSSRSKINEPSFNCCDGGGSNSNDFSIVSLSFFFSYPFASNFAANQINHEHLINRREPTTKALD